VKIIQTGGERVNAGKESAGSIGADLILTLAKLPAGKGRMLQSERWRAGGPRQIDSKLSYQFASGGTPAAADVFDDSFLPPLGSRLIN
jgi:hypothetical protein